MLNSWKRIEIEDSRDSERSFLVTLTYDITKYAIAANGAAIAFLSTFVPTVIVDPSKHGGTMLWAVSGIALFFIGLVTGCLGIAFLWLSSFFRLYHANKALSSNDSGKQNKHLKEFERIRKFKIIAPFLLSASSVTSFVMGVKLSIVRISFFINFDIWHYLYIHIFPQF